MTMKNLNIKEMFAACINIRKNYQSYADIKDLPLKKKLLISFIVIAIISNLSGVIGGIFLLLNKYIVVYWKYQMLFNQIQQ